MADEKAKAAKPAKGQPQGGQGKGGQQGGGKKDKGAAGNVDHAPKAREGAPRLQTYYQQTVRGRLAKEFGLTNPNQVPRLEKIVLNMGLGEAIQNAKILDSAVTELAAITGQRPVVTKAKKAIANFKLRKGLPIGCMVTLRGDRMYEFLDRLVNIALPRVRDFKGVSDKSFDGRGNYSLGIREEIIFPEVDIDKVEKVKGLTINICTTAKSDDEGRALLKALGVPFRAA
jgi:large subunit ribosomal protein L5